MELRWAQAAADDLEPIADYLFEHAPSLPEKGRAFARVLGRGGHGSTIRREAVFDGALGGWGRPANSGSHIRRSIDNTGQRVDFQGDSNDARYERSWTAEKGHPACISSEVERTRTGVENHRGSF